MEIKKRKRWDCIADRMEGREKITGCEVGIYKAKMAVNLLELMPNLTLVAVDRWAKYSGKEKIGDSSGVIVKYTKKQWEKIYNIALDALIPHIKRVHILREDSKAAALRFENEQFDFVFIDADHSYKGVKNDIKHWKNKVRQCGYLCGHDYSRAGVFKAVNEAFKKDEIEVDADKTWFVRRK